MFLRDNVNVEIGDEVYSIVNGEIITATIAEFVKENKVKLLFYKSYFVGNLCYYYGDIKNAQKGLVAYWQEQIDTAQSILNNNKEQYKKAVQRLES